MIRRGSTFQGIDGIAGGMLSKGKRAQTAS